MAAKKTPKPKRKKPDKDQSERFKKAARDLVNAGELNLTEAEGKFDHALANVIGKRVQSPKK